MEGGEIQIILKLGVGFGDGTHPTTQLCLQALSALAPQGDRAWRLLDFGSGSGILSIGAAKLGATVEAVEVDPAAIQTAEENARLNSVGDRIRHHQALDEVRGPFDLILANILRPVLVQSAGPVCARLSPGGTLVVSGLVSTDVPEVSVRYASFLGGRRPLIHPRGEWRALSWKLGT